MDDFGRNELFVKESLAEYSKSIVNSISEERTENTLSTIYLKLERINSILLKNDKGLNGDLRLRDAFINLNSKTISLFKSKTLRLNDYKELSAMSLEEIDKVFKRKESDIEDYYAEVLNFEKMKREFGLQYDIKIRSSIRKNILEYNAMENLLFYKINVIDEKLINLINQNKSDEIVACMSYLNTISDDALLKVAIYKQEVNDISLNSANKKFIEYMKINNGSLYSYYVQFDKLNKELQQMKLDTAGVSNEEYNATVRNFNTVKNIYYSVFDAIQNKKQAVINKWYISNSDFLKNNIQFENNYERYTDVD